MRRPRRKLEVSTFPFLAVLLGAMGSLIFLLMVMDRRAKIVAIAKLHESRSAAQNSRSAQAIEAERKQREDWERQREQLHELLARQEQDLRGQLQSLLGEAGKSTQELQTVAQTQQRMQAMLDAENGKLTRERDELRGRQATLLQSTQLEETTRTDLARLTRELFDLEQTLAGLKRVKSQQQPAYSLVPYRGQRGENRLPIYIECTRAGLVFLPDRMHLTGEALDSPRIREEVERRHGPLVKAVKGGDPFKTPSIAEEPYVLFLIRPDGIASYYRGQNALRGFQIDFGYELVDADWALEISTRPPGQFVQNPSVSPTPGRTSSGVRGAFSGVGMTGRTDGNGSGEGPLGNGGTSSGAPRAGLSFGGVGSGKGGLGGGSGTDATSGAGRFGPNNGNIGPGDVTLANPNGEVGTGPAPGTTRSGTGSGGLGSVSNDGGGPTGNGNPSGPANINQRVTPGALTSLGQGSVGSAGAGGNNGDAPGTASGAPNIVFRPAQPEGGPKSILDGPTPGLKVPGSAANPGSGGNPSGGAAGGSANGQPPTVGDGNAAAKSADVNRQPGGTQQSQANNQPPEAGNAMNRLAPPALPAANLSEKKTPTGPTSIGRVVGNRDFIVTLGCYEEGVFVTPGGASFTWNSQTNAKQMDEALVRTVTQMVNRRQATVRAGEPPYRAVLRFEVHDRGRRTYYHVYPLLESLRLPMVRDSVEE